MNRRAFLRQQRESFQKLGRPRLRLCDDPLADPKGLPTTARLLRVDGGGDGLRCRQCRELIAQTALGAGLQIPVESTAFDVGAHSLLRLARELKLLRVVSVTATFWGRAKKADGIKGRGKMEVPIEYSSIDDLVPVALAWCDVLLARDFASPESPPPADVRQSGLKAFPPPCNPSSKFR
jgi:hypothetical protein